MAKPVIGILALQGDFALHVKSVKRLGMESRLVRDAETLQQCSALILPGGFGAAKNLCDFAVNGPDCEVDEGVAALVRAVHEQGKPVAAVCIAPALLAKVLGDEGPELTIGTDAETAGALAKMGVSHVECPVTEFVVDRDRKLITSPAYMLAQSISEAAEGIEKTVAALIEMA